MTRIIINEGLSPDLMGLLESVIRGKQPKWSLKNHGTSVVVEFPDDEALKNDIIRENKKRKERK